MTDEEFALGLKQMLIECRLSERRAAARQAHFKCTAREQNIQLAIGRLKVDAARAALEAQMAARQVRN
jgi:hypothetical protein